MNRSKNIIVAGALTLSIGAGAILATPQAMKASSNVVLASVDWVTSQLNPMKTKLTELENKINSQQQEINSLKTQLSQVGTNPVTPPPTTTEPPATGDLPSTVYAANATVNIHSGATKDYKVIATQTKGTSLKVIDKFNSATGLWYRVELSATLKGWVFSNEVSVTKPSTSGPTQVVTTGEVYLRKGATTSYAVLQTLPKGTTLKYISTFTNTKGEIWYNAETSAGVKGWISGTLSEVK
ncbi:SH3 domain-containing protein [Bacillus sp. S/N-304-OC-R1]|uniref:SH3 domain-containing protein n=1 Tax=Bacillus sp. S/N-304-OC-R1 TaxID=2758034 RepID=UPI001C8EA34E|nr:SH3 domain-containing protein [Bacillus sp. S/N-304-OC-R1]MBY0123487.1 SH3 domain-containing protein [Bacillus sp. S/N-304-OC-R1]